VYAALGAPDGDTDYFIWSNQAPTSSTPKALGVEQLAQAFAEQVSRSQACARKTSQAQTATHA
jgi:hypothetical protein